MPTVDTSLMNLGHWITAFYLVYALAAVAVIASLIAIVDSLVNAGGNRRMARAKAVKTGRHIADPES